MWKARVQPTAASEITCWRRGQPNVHVGSCLNRLDLTALRDQQRPSFSSTLQPHLGLPEGHLFQGRAR